jgi:hypothetical protein
VQHIYRLAGALYLPGAHQEAPPEMVARVMSVLLDR